MSYLLLFSEGILTFISPCLLPMLPLYLSYFIGKSDQKGSALKNALLFMFGFTLVFMSLSLLMNSVGRFVISHRTGIQIAVGIFLMFLAIDMWFDHRWSSKFQGNLSRSIINVNSFVFGVIFATTWTPCIGVYLASALAISLTSQNMLEALGLTFIYCLGLGLLFILCALLVEESRKIMKSIQSNLHWLQKLAAGCLFIFGLLMCLGMTTQGFI